MIFILEKMDDNAEKIELIKSNSTQQKFQVVGNAFIQRDYRLLTF